MLKHFTIKDNITIVIPLFNQRMFNLVLEGFCLQTNSNYKLIIVSDGGEDFTQTIIKYVDKIDLEYYYLYSPPNSFCAGSARNLGAFLTETERVVFLDGDCIPSPNFVKHSSIYKSERMIIAGVRNRIRLDQQMDLTDISKLSTIATDCDDRYLTEPEWRKKRSYEITMMESGGHTYPYYCHSFSINCLTNDFKLINGFSCSYHDFSGEDQDLAVRLCKLKGYTTLLDRKIVCYHLDHDTSKLARNIHELSLTESNPNPIRDQELIQYEYQRRI